MTDYLKLKEDRELVSRAENLRLFNDRFVEDIQDYVKLLVQSNDLNVYTYTRLNKTVFKFPVLGYIGKMGLEGEWNDPFNTCCRYAIMEYGESELEEGASVLEELVDRVSHGKQVIPNMPKNKQEAAYKALERLSYIMNLVLVGLELMKDMKNHLETGGGFMDIRHNETSWLWKNAVRELELV